MRLIFGKQNSGKISQLLWCLIPIAGLFFTQVSLATTIVPASTSKIDAESKEKVSQRGAIPGAENDTVTLGTAYHSKKRGFYGLQSVNGVIDETYGNTRAEVQVGVDLGYKEVLDMVSGNVEASLNIPAIRVDAGASYAKETAADEYTGSYTIYVSVKPKKRTLVPQTDQGFQPTTAAINLVEAYPGDKYEQVGDEFVTAIEYGSFLIVNLKVEFKSAKDKRDIGGYLGVDWVGKINVSGELALLDEEIKQSVKISVSALQSGGNVHELVEIIPDGLMQCSLNNPSPCFDMFEDTVVYLKDRYINQFDTLDKYNVVKLYSRRYDESGADLMSLVPEEYEEVSFASKVAYKKMSESWVNSLLHRRRAENILTYYSASLTSAQKNTINLIADDAQYNSFLYADAVAFCDKNPLGDYCYDQMQITETYTRGYDKTVLDLSVQ